MITYGTCSLVRINTVSLNDVGIKHLRQHQLSKTQKTLVQVGFSFFIATLHSLRKFDKTEIFLSEHEQKQTLELNYL